MLSMLFKSRKFWLLILETVISLLLYFIPKYLPGAEADTRVLILALQPVFVAIIMAIAVEDSAAMKAGLRKF